MNRLFIILLMVLLSACGGEDTSEAAQAAAPVPEKPKKTEKTAPKKAPATGNTIALVDNLRIRDQPGTDGKVVATVDERAELIWNNEKSDQKETITLRGVALTEHWVKVQIPNTTKEGWVFGGAIAGTDDVRNVGKGGKYAHFGDALYLLRRGNRINVLNSTHIADKAFKIEASDVTIAGQADASLQVRGNYESVLWLNNVTDVTVKGLLLRHTKPQNGPELCGRAGVIALTNCEDILIEDCDINGCGFIGVAIRNTAKVGLRNNHIHNNSWSAVNDNNDVDWYTTPEVPDIFASGNIIENNGYDKILLDTTDGPENVALKYAQYAYNLGGIWEVLHDQDGPRFDLREVLTHTGVLAPAFVDRMVAEFDRSAADEDQSERMKFLVGGSFGVWNELETGKVSISDSVASVVVYKVDPKKKKKTHPVRFELRRSNGHWLIADRIVDPGAS